MDRLHPKSLRTKLQHSRDCICSRITHQLDLAVPYVASTAIRVMHAISVDFDPTVRVGDKTVSAC